MTQVTRDGAAAGGLRVSGYWASLSPAVAGIIKMTEVIIVSTARPSRAGRRQAAGRSSLRRRTENLKKDLELTHDWRAGWSTVAPRKGPGLRLYT